MPKPRYQDDADWEDVIPLPQDDGGQNALAVISYTEEYSEAIAYLRAIMADNEHSERVLRLTAHIIDLNPAHYTVWLYRAKTLQVLSSDLHAEVEWLNAVALKYIKNYQIWHHRQLVISRLNSVEGEFDFLAEMLDKDAKNYHVWSYRQWLVKKFDLWDAGELQECERFLNHDIRNNSAWNHRWFVVFGKLENQHITSELFDREIKFAEDAIRRAPQNESSWNYLRGLVRRANKPWSTIEDIALEFASVDEPERIRSTHALDVLAEVYAADAATEKQARTALDLLATKYDPIRANYWSYRQAVITSARSPTSSY